MKAEGVVGPGVYQDGAGPVSLRQGKEGGLIISGLHGYFTETAFRGSMMIASNAVAGVAPGTAFSTTPPITLWNPPGSGKVLSIIKVAMGYVSGTLGAGVVAAGYTPNQVTVPSTGTELTPNNCLLGAPRGVGRAFTGSTLVAAPSIIRPIFNMGAMLATSVFQPTDTVDVIDGAICVPPGIAFAMQGIATAGTTPLVIFSIEWDEITA